MIFWHGVWQPVGVLFQVPLGFLVYYLLERAEKYNNEVLLINHIDLLFGY